MKWQRRFKARLRQRLQALGVRIRPAEDQKVPYWPGQVTAGAHWNHDLLFEQKRSILALFIPVDRENLCDERRYIAAAIAAGDASVLARDAVHEEIDRSGR